MIKTIKPTVMKRFINGWTIVLIIVYTIILVLAFTACTKQPLEDNTTYIQLTNQGVRHNFYVDKIQARSDTFCGQRLYQIAFRQDSSELYIMSFTIDTLTIGTHWADLTYFGRINTFDSINLVVNSYNKGVLNATFESKSNKFKNGIVKNLFIYEH